MEQRVKLVSGKDLTVQRSSFELSIKLLRTILKEAQKAGVKIDESALFSGDIMKKDTSDFIRGDSGLLDTILNSLINVVCSEEMEKLIFKSCERCAWDKQRITPALFDEDEDAMADYFEICYHVVRENLRPFSKNLSTLFGTIVKKLPTQDTQSQE